MVRSKSWFRNFYSVSRYQNILTVKSTLTQQSWFFFLLFTAVSRAIKDSPRAAVETQASAYRLLGAGTDKQPVTPASVWGARQRAMPRRCSRSGAGRAGKEHAQQECREVSAGRAALWRGSCRALMLGIFHRSRVLCIIPTGNVCAGDPSSSVRPCGSACCQGLCAWGQLSVPRLLPG